MKGFALLVLLSVVCPSLARRDGWTEKHSTVGRIGKYVDVPRPPLAPALAKFGLVYVNTLMLQQILAQPHWTGRLTATDLRALTPLIWEHVNPYGRFELDMATRLPLA